MAADQTFRRERRQLEIMVPALQQRFAELLFELANPPAKRAVRDIEQFGDMGVKLPVPPATTKTLSPLSAGIFRCKGVSAWMRRTGRTFHAFATAARPALRRIHDAT